MVLAGALVVIGLLMESWPEIKLAIIERRFPNLTVTGGVIVTVGVLIEVVLGIFITQRANRAQSEANERVARSEKATSEANLARAKIEERLAWRTITAEQRKSLVQQLSKFAGQQVRISIWPVLTELAVFQHFVAATLKEAGWNWSLERIPGPPVLTNGFVVLSTADAQSKEAAEALRKALDSMGGGGSGIIGNLEKPEDPRVHIVIQERGGPYPDDVLFR